MLNSSIWFEREQREIFITALLMAEPYLCEESAEQLHVDRLEKTGFVAPAGPYGIVRAAGSAIIRLAMVDTDRGYIALAQLGEPDKDSRSREYDGRRMIRVNGGYLILNYFKYREYDRTGAERQQRYREKKKLQGVTRNGNDITRDKRNEVTHAEAEAEAEAEKEESLFFPLSATESAAPPKKKKNPKPADYEEVRAYVCETLKLPENDAISLWEHWQGNGFTNNKTAMASWKATASNWERRGIFFPSLQGKGK